MDELEWLKENAPSAKPSRDIAKRHRTQLRAEIASEGADGTRPRRLRRARRGRHRVFVTTIVVVALCAVGAGVIALAASGGDDDASTVGAPASSSAAPTTATVRACADAPPKTLAIPDGFGNPVAGPAKDALTAPSSAQQVTTWSSASTSIEQRWPADAEAAKQYGGISTGPADGSSSSAADPVAKVDESGIARRTIVFTFSGPPSECSYLQVTVSGRDEAEVDKVTNDFIVAPYATSEPLVTTTAAAASAPSVVACDAAARGDVKPTTAVVATVGGRVTRRAFAQPLAALADFLVARRTLPQRGYEELHVDDSTFAYAKPGTTGGVVTTVEVVATSSGWTVRDWQASGC
jgi:hypothetical protein